MFWDCRDLAQPKVIKILEGHCLAADGVLVKPGISANGQVLAMGGSDNFVYLWDAVTCHLIQKVSGHWALPTEISFSESGIMASSSLDGSIILTRAS